MRDWKSWKLPNLGSHQHYNFFVPKIHFLSKKITPNQQEGSLHFFFEKK